MSSNEHPDMSGNPCDQPLICDQCGKEFDDSVLYGSLVDANKVFCSSPCARTYDEDHTTLEP
jgi:hypothetical protein